MRINGEFLLIIRCKESQTCSLIVRYNAYFLRDNLIIFLVNTNYATFLEVKENNSSTKCTTEYHFEQYGLYKFSLDNCTTSVQVTYILTRKPVILTYFEI
jgi:hypothetical protein